MSDTVEGKKHDKKIVDEENLSLPQGISLYQDTDFQGFKPEGVLNFQPQKKPKGKDLTAEEKHQNSLISRVRISVEHVIAGIKRCRIVKEVFRNTKNAFDDLVFGCWGEMEQKTGLSKISLNFCKTYSKTS